MDYVSDKLSLIEAKGVIVKNPFTFEMGESSYLRANYMIMCKARQDLWVWLVWLFYFVKTAWTTIKFLANE